MKKLLSLKFFNNIDTKISMIISSIASENMKEFILRYCLLNWSQLYSSLIYTKITFVVYMLRYTIGLLKQGEKQETNKAGLNAVIRIGERYGQGKKDNKA